MHITHTAGWRVRVRRRRAARRAAALRPRTGEAAVFPRRLERVGGDWPEARLGRIDRWRVDALQKRLRAAPRCHGGSCDLLAP
jgi:hypothetical protein